MSPYSIFTTSIFLPQGPNPPLASFSSEAAAPGLGVTLHSKEEGGGASFRVWAPHATAATLELKAGGDLPLSREGDCWAARFKEGVLTKGE